MSRESKSDTFPWLDLGEQNRVVHRDQRLENLDIPKEGLSVD